MEEGIILGYSNRLWLLANWMDLLGSGVLSDAIVAPSTHGTLYGVIVDLWVTLMPAKLAAIVADVKKVAQVPAQQLVRGPD